MPSSIAAVPGAGAWSERHGLLYCGIPARVLAHCADPGVVVACWQLLVEAELVLSVFRDDSELTRLNARSDQHLSALSPLLASALRAAQEAWDLSTGTCDASVGALSALWREALRVQRWPTPQRLREACPRAAGRRFAVQDGRLLLVDQQPLCFDLGGIAKGFLVDRCDALLCAAGVTDALIQLGGETSCRGISPRGRRWRIAVQHPVISQQHWCVLQAPERGLSCSTSGDYRQRRTIAARPVSHLIDPRDGSGASDDLLAVTALSAHPGRVATCEALTKAGVFLEAADSTRRARAARGELLILRAQSEAIESVTTANWPELVLA